LENVIIIGAGKFTKNIIGLIEESYNILCVADNNSDKHNTFFDEEKKYKIISPMQIKEYKYDKIIIGSFIYKDEFVNQLLSLNIPKEKIILDYVYRIVNIDIKDIFFSQFFENESFNRFDIIVRYLAIENYYGKNNFGFKLYNKMQEKRLGKGYIVSEDRFKELIVSYEKYGYKDESCIECDSNFGLIDGSHRMSLNIYHDIEKINVKIMSITTDIKYGIDWFIENEFSKNEVEIIKNKYEEILNKLNTPFVCILWPAVQRHFDDIMEDISKYSTIIEWEDIELNSKNLNLITKIVYSIDDIESWKIEKKIEAFGNVGSRMRLIKLREFKPGYRLKQLNGKPLSCKMEKLKKIIRDKYRIMINNYFEDIIIHIADNLEQSKFMELCFEIFYITVSNPKIMAGSLLEKRLEILKAWCIESNIPISDVCVVNGSILELYNVRKANDFDFLVKTKYRRNAVINEAFFDIDSDYFKMNNKILISDDEIVDNPDYHFKIGDLKFINFHLVCYRKLFMKRKHDKRDLSLILNKKV